MKKMPLDEFQKIGLLQEINRQFLHPMGLALMFDTRDDNVVTSVEIWDARDDPEGILFAPDVINEEKVFKVVEMFEAKRKMREARLGYHVQPIK
jgi:hypothetical protein